MASMKDILNLGLKVLKLTGFSKDQTIFDKFQLYLTIVITLLIDILILYNLKNVKVNIEEITVYSESAWCFIEMTAYLLMMLLNKDGFMSIIEMQKYFWNHAEFGKPFAKTCSKTYKVFGVILKMFIAFTWTTAVMVNIKSLMYGILPYECWIPEGKSWLLLISLMQIYATLYIAITAPFLIAIYAIAMIEISFQLELLNKAFSSMENLNDLKRCINYHNFLYKYFLLVKNTFSFILIIEYIKSIILLCMELLIFADKRQMFELRVKSMLFVLVIVIQLSFYCIPSSWAKSSSENSSYAVGSSNLVLHPDLTVRKSIIFVIKRSQKYFEVKAGEMFEFDLNALVQAFKSGFSVYTLMKHFQNN